MKTSGSLKLFLDGLRFQIWDNLNISLGLKLNNHKRMVIA